MTSYLIPLTYDGCYLPACMELTLPLGLGTAWVLVHGRRATDQAKPSPGSGQVFSQRPGPSSTGSGPSRSRPENVPWHGCPEDSGRPALLVCCQSPRHPLEVRPARWGGGGAANVGGRKTPENGAQLRVK